MADFCPCRYGLPGRCDHCDPKEEDRSKCPFPWTGDDGTVEQCIKNDHCGCVYGNEQDTTH